MCAILKLFLLLDFMKIIQMLKKKKSKILPWFCITAVCKFSLMSDTWTYLNTSEENFSFRLPHMLKCFIWGRLGGLVG